MSRPPLPLDFIPGPGIGEAKVVEYLLNLDHPEGRPKARFFLERGFRLEEPKPFVQALIDHGAVANLIRTIETEYGRKFVCEAPLMTPDGTNPRVRSIWLHRNDEHLWFVRLLVTAYPF